MKLTKHDDNNNHWQLPPEERRDLTHLTSWAIDEEGCHDPDDAISLDGPSIWIHIADVAAIITNESSLDWEARERGGTLYLPEGNVPMLPEKLIALLGLGLAEISPALSFQIATSGPSQYKLLDYCPSWIRATKISYHKAEEMLKGEKNEALIKLQQTLTAFKQQCTANGAISFQFPDVKIKLIDSKVQIKCTPIGAAREFVSQAMVLGGYAIAEFCQQQRIPIPYVQQLQLQQPVEAVETLWQSYAIRRKMNPSVVKVSPGEHAGLGLDFYTRATSPLRRYPDLLVHQQIRRFFYDRPLISDEHLIACMAVAEVAGGRLRSAMNLSQRHWTLVYLEEQQCQEWPAILLERRERRGIFYIEDIGLEVSVALRQPMEVGTKIKLHWCGNKLAYGACTFSIKK